MFKNKIRRLCVLLLCALMLLPSLAACSSPEGEWVPDGMQIASCYGADYRLYVPTSWNLNTAYGVSGAYYNLSTQSTVSVAKYGVPDEMKTAMEAAGKDSSVLKERLNWFFETSLKTQAASLATGGVTVDGENCTSVLLDDLNAQKYCYSALIDGETLNFLQVVGERSNTFYVFTFTATTEAYEALIDNVNTMLEQFIFADPYVPMTYSKELDENAEAPEGMKLASNGDVAYLFYVPADWEINLDEEIFSAYVRSDPSNANSKIIASVSIVPYMPSGEGMSIEEYCSMSAEMLTKTGTYTALPESDTVCELGGRTAMKLEYTYALGEHTYRYLQLVTAYKGMLYSLTYTSTEENYATYLDDVNQIIGAFAFR